jgi:DNA-binding NarL/FixJ family response regulator
MVIRIQLADRHRLFREGLKCLFASQPDMKIVAESGEGNETVALARKHVPDVLLLDLAMPGLNGVDAARYVLAECPQIKVVALCGAHETGVADVLQAGARAVVPKTSPFAELADAIRAVTANKVYLNPDVAGMVLDRFVHLLPGHNHGGAGAAASSSDGGHPDEAGPGLVYSKLTPRERQVLQLVAEGLSTKQIAAAQHVSVKTIESHRTEIMARLGIHSIAELTKYALREGLTSLEE